MVNKTENFPASWSLLSTIRDGHKTNKQTKRDGHRHIHDRIIKHCNDFYEVN